MFKKIGAFSLALLFVLTASAAFAQAGKQFLVLPVKYNGPNTYKYLKEGVRMQLEKKLTWPGQYSPVKKDAGDVKFPSSEAQALRLCDQLGVDALVWASVNQMGSSTGVILEAAGRNGNKWRGETQVNINELPLWLESSAENIQGEVYQRPGYGEKKKSLEELTSEQRGDRQAPQNSSIIAGSSEGVTQPKIMTLNPNFRYEGGAQTPGRWRSQTLRFPSYSMVVGDGDGDGENEVFVLGKDYLHAYRYKDGKLEPLAKYDLVSNPSTTYLRLSIIDMDRDGAAELVITSRSYDRPDSSILSFKGGKFTELKTSIREYLATMNTPPTYQPTLVAQSRGRRGPFSDDMYEVTFNGKELVRVAKVPRPPYGTVFSMNYLPDEGSYKVVVIDEMQRLRVYQPDLESLYQGEETFNSSVVGFELDDKQYGMGSMSDSRQIKEHYVIPFRMVPAAITNPNKYEMLVNKDITMAGQVFERFTTYSQGEIHALFWDGVGMSLAWKTRRIKGTVTDLGYQDIDNDGEKELCVLLNTNASTMSFARRKTMILAYDLNN
ncbi:FG-GAP repeat domain-containing protein [Salidesulfovibrio brasiliensis]